MHHFTKFCALAFVAANVLPAQAQSPIIAPSTDEPHVAATNSGIFGVDLSPDGGSYAILKQYGDQRVAAIHNADNADIKPIAVGLGDIDTGAFKWGGDNHVLLQVFGEQSGIDTTSGVKTLTVSRWLSISKDTGKSVTLFGKNQIGNDYLYIMTSAGSLVSILPNQADRALFARGTVRTQSSAATRLRDGDDSFVFSLMSADLKNGRIRRLELGKEQTVDWVVNEKGDAIARIDTGASDRQLQIYARSPGVSSFRRVAEVDFDISAIEHVDFYGIGKNEGFIQALTTDNTGAQKLVEFDLDSGAFGNVLFEPASKRISKIEYDHRRNKATAVYYNDGGQRVHHLSEIDQSHQQRLEIALKAAAVAIISKSLNGERMIAKAFYQDRPTEYYFYDIPGKRLELIAQE